MLPDCEPGDMLLFAQTNRVSSDVGDGMKIRAELESEQVRIVVLDLATSCNLAVPADQCTGRMVAGVILLDVLAAAARNDCKDRRHRQAEGSAGAKSIGRYDGRSENKVRIAASPP
ncbi:MAG: recombinase family protein [Pseudomonadota bacterium]|nr:recombinase family protein [Pseudomonadota bacterium]